MIRHAEAPFIPGQERTRGLSEAGLQAAEQVASRLRGQRIDAVVSSPMARAIQTVQHVAEERKLTILLAEVLRERIIHAEDVEVTWAERESAIERSFADPDYALPGGETTRQAEERALPVLKRLLAQYEGQAIAVGTHGQIMTIMMRAFDGRYDHGFWKRTTMPDIYRLELEGEQLQRVERLWG
nr:histidine phosphatase family protein [Paenibacillus phyllosphaerae]